MPAAKIAISIEESILKEIDSLVKKKIFPNRSKAIQEAVKDKRMRITKSSLDKECDK